MKDLYNEISNILGLDKRYTSVIIGAGNIGQAIANYTRFDKFGFDLQGIFDKNPKLIGMRMKDIEINDIDNLEDFLNEHKIDIGIICVPSSQAQKVADTMVATGVRGIWNFAPMDLKVPENISVENVHLSESILTLVYLMNDQDK